MFFAPASLAQLAEATVSEAVRSRFESEGKHHAEVAQSGRGARSRAWRLRVRISPSAPFHPGGVTESVRCPVATRRPAAHALLRGFDSRSLLHIRAPTCTFWRQRRSGSAVRQSRPAHPPTSECVLSRPDQEHEGQRTNTALESSRLSSPKLRIVRVCPDWMTPTRSPGFQLLQAPSASPTTPQA